MVILRYMTIPLCLFSFVESRETNHRLTKGSGTRQNHSLTTSTSVFQIGSLFLHFGGNVA